MSKSVSRQEMLMKVEREMCTMFGVSGPGIRSSTEPISDLSAESVDDFKLSCSLEGTVSTELECRRLFFTKRSNIPAAPHELTISEAADYIKAQLMAGDGDEASSAQPDASLQGLGSSCAKWW
jgi:hypothetical protein